TNSSPVANPRLLTPEQEFEVFASMSSKDREWCIAYAEEQANCLRKTIEISHQLAVDLPHVNFVLRPHPFENPEPYESVLGKCRNVKIVQQGAIDGFLLRAKCAVMRVGTTTLDAGLSGIPILSYHWVPVKYQYSEESESILHPCHSYEALREQVEAVVEGSYRRPPEIEGRIEDALFQRFHKRDGRAHVRVADVIESGLDRGVSSGKKGILGMKLWGWAAKIARKKAIDGWKNSVKFFDGETVRGILDSFQNLDLSEFPELKVPIDLSVPPMPLEGGETFKCRAVLMKPKR
ncbi:MAG: glycosyltransferase family protein, partial [Planctomycetota bacterium]